MSGQIWQQHEARRRVNGARTVSGKTQTLVKPRPFFLWFGNKHVKAVAYYRGGHMVMIYEKIRKNTHAYTLICMDVNHGENIFILSEIYSFRASWTLDESLSNSQCTCEWPKRPPLPPCLEADTHEMRIWFAPSMARFEDTSVQFLDTYPYN